MVTEMHTNTSTNREELEQALEDAYETQRAIRVPYVPATNRDTSPVWAAHFATVKAAEAVITAAATALEDAGVDLLECHRCDELLPEDDCEWLQLCCVSWDCPGEFAPIHKGCDPSNDY